MTVFRSSHCAAMTACALMASSFSNAPAFAKREPLVLESSSQWHLDCSPDSCRLARQFGEGDDRVVMILTRYEPGMGSQMLLSGNPLRGIAKGGEAEITFGPSEETRQ